MAELVLARVQRDNSSELVDLAREFEAAGETAFDDALPDPEKYFARLAAFETGKDLPPDRVRQQEYWLFSGTRIVGNSRLRLALIPKLELDGGNISYNIRPSERRKGYGREILRLTLAEAQKQGLRRALLTAAPSNEASIRIILANGGHEIEPSTSPFSGEPLRRFEVLVHGHAAKRASGPSQGVSVP